jgi:hypothetical protein
MTTTYPTTKLPAASNEVVDHLRASYGWDEDRARRVLQIATEFGAKAEPTKGGYVLISRIRAWFAIEDHTGRTAQ